MRHDLHVAGRAFRLRPVAGADAPYIVSLRARQSAFLNRGAATAEAQSQWLDRYFARDDDFYFVVETLDGRRREGLVGIYDVSRVERTGQWGRWVLEPWSSAAVESALLVYRCAFERLLLERVWCRTLMANAKVVAFHDSCGLTRAPCIVTIDRDGRAEAAVEHVLWEREWPVVMTRLDRIATRVARAAMASAAAQRS